MVCVCVCVCVRRVRVVCLWRWCVACRPIPGSRVGRAAPFFSRPTSEILPIALCSQRPLVRTVSVVETGMLAVSYQQVRVVRRVRYERPAPGVRFVRVAPGVHSVYA